MSRSCPLALFSIAKIQEQPQHGNTAVQGLGSVRDVDITKIPASLGQAKNLHVLPQFNVEFSNDRHKRVIRICGFLFNLADHVP